jgi:drug/metabolite transporter (DMT)-like permease
VNQSASHLRAIAYAIAGFTCWVFGDTFLKLIGGTAVPGYEILTIGSFGGMAVIFVVTTARGKIARLKPKRYGGLIILGLIYLFSYACWLTALPRLPLDNFYVIIFLAPIIITILAALFLKEHLRWQHGVAIVAGFGGVLVSIDPQRLLADRSGWLGYSAAFAGTLSFALQMLGLRILARRESRECAAFWPRGVAAAVCLLAVAVWGIEPIPARVILFALASGSVGGIGWLCMAEAYKAAPAAIVAPFHYSQIIIATVLGYFIWHDVPAPRLLVGAVFIIASGFYIVTHVRKSTTLLKNESHT